MRSVSSAKLGCVGVLHLVQALAATERPDRRRRSGSSPARRSRSRIAPARFEVAQSPLWGLGRVAINEYQNLRCRLVDLATCSDEEIESLAEELNAGGRRGG